MAVRQVLRQWDNHQYVNNVSNSLSKTDTMNKQKEVVINKTAHGNKVHKINYRMNDQVVKPECGMPAKKQKVVNLSKAAKNSFNKFCDNCFNSKEQNKVGKIHKEYYECRECGNEQLEDKVTRWKCENCETLNIC